MIISVTSPRKRMGQTISSINLSAMLAKTMREPVALIDMNAWCRDVEYYLSDTSLTKGLDDFCSLYSSQLLNKQTFRACVKNIHPWLDIMAANECFKVGTGEVKILFDFVRRSYKAAVIDTANRNMPEEILHGSDVIIVVLTQARNVVQCLEKTQYQLCKDKIIFLINQYVEQYGDLKIGYDCQTLKNDLKNLGYDNPVFMLEYDGEITNECNDQTVLNYVFNEHNRSRKYVRQLESVAKYLFQAGGMGECAGDAVLPDRKSAFKLLPRLNLPYNLKKTGVYSHEP